MIATIPLTSSRWNSTCSWGIRAELPWHVLTWLRLLSLSVHPLPGVHFASQMTNIMILSS